MPVRSVANEPITEDEKRRWLEALRSGKYQQCKRALRMVDPDTDKLGYCCLGVACETFGPGFASGINDGGMHTTKDGCTAKWPIFYMNDLQGPALNHAIQMNDDGSSFAEIADYLEESLPALTPEEPTTPTA